MKYNIIGSSSKGNCIVVEDFLMLDCGVSYKKLEKYLKQVKLVFISHIHKDHLLPATIKKISYEHPTIKFLCSSTEVAEALVKKCYVPFRNIIILVSGAWWNLGMLKVKTQELQHDVSNFALKFEIKGKKGIYMVDTADTNGIVAKDYDLFLIEANYNQAILEEHIRNCEDENEMFYLQRIPNTHLSFEMANSFLIENMGNQSEYCYIHKSSYNYKEVE